MKSYMKPRVTRGGCWMAVDCLWRFKGMKCYSSHFLGFRVVLGVSNASKS